MPLTSSQRRHVFYSDVFKGINKHKKPHINQTLVILGAGFNSDTDLCDRQTALLNYFLWTEKFQNECISASVSISS